MLSRFEIREPSELHQVLPQCMFYMAQNTKPPSKLQTRPSPISDRPLPHGFGCFAVVSTRVMVPEAVQAVFPTGRHIGQTSPGINAGQPTGPGGLCYDQGPKPTPFNTVG